MNSSILKTLFISMEQGIVFIDDRDRIAYCNPAAEKIRNMDAMKVLGQSVLNCHPQRIRSKVLRVIRNLKSGNIKGHRRMNIQTTNGKFYDITYSAVWDLESHYLGTVVIRKEITQRKRVEDKLKQALKKLKAAKDELMRLDRTKDDFLSNVSHELKTPMISVMGYTGMVLKEKAGPLTEQQRRFLEICYKNLQKLEKNIDNLFDLAEIGIHRRSWTFEPTDLIKLIQFACLTAEPLAKTHQIEFDIKLPPGPVKMSGVDEQLNQLFDNLLTYAIKYSRQSGKIYVNLEHDSESIFVRIADTGVGIPTLSLKEVFTCHFKGNTASPVKTRGFGIGLSLVHEIVKLHQGDIQIQSELGKGTTFELRLPKTVNPSSSPSKPRGE